ncbi:hypothetical protein BIT28_15030 [Photobacterium proteolyticum]|uniref:Uncharacterized protein n=1 Tax=Photobacterium proteolyticum TaxID=1903952 RepID=A0A1Q9G8R3_9GAMM|nr:hypothetical protein [Photobacterium proteolyticum]OLQ70733.1 hypothetical protein BIT28_15030 [Photobacterium proteolyticum]
MPESVGLGCPQFAIAAYIENHPNMLNYQSLDQLTTAGAGEIHAIGQACGNGWRKVFNVYAKLIFELDTTYFPYAKSASTWQAYRDHYLLQSDSHTSLMFSPPILSAQRDLQHQPHATIHIIMGRTYAKQLIKEGKLNCPMQWLDNEFAINTEHRVIVCPYFDYRQLSNIKIQYLAKLMKSLVA